MNWFDVVKIIGIPRGTIFLSNIVVNRAEFENTLDKLRNIKSAPTSFQNMLNRSNKTHEDYYSEGVEAETTEINLSEEESKEMFDEMLQLISEKVKEFTERKYYSIEKIRKLLSAAMAAKNNDDKDKVAEIILEITENINPKREFLKDYIPERDRLEFLKEYLEEDGGKTHLFFENSPSNKKILTDFAEMIGGTVKGDKILVNFESQTDLVRLLQPKIDKKTRKVLDDEATVELKKKRLEFYNEKIRPLKPKLKTGTITTAIDSRKLEARELNIRGAKYELVGTFSEESVSQYIEIVEGLKNAKGIWKPQEFENGEPIPEGLVFLPRQANTTKSLILNPYASIVLFNDFGKDWFTPFFNALRTNEVLSDGEVDRIIIDDISNALLNGKAESRLKIRTASFSRLQGVRNLILTKPNDVKKRLNEMLRQIISENQGEGNLGEEITQKKLNIRREQLTLLERYFTVREGKKILDFLKEQYDEDDITTRYYDSTGTKIEEIEGDAQSYMERVENAYYVDFEMFEDEDEVINQTNYKDWVEGVNLSQVSRPKSKNPTRGLEIALKELEQALAGLPNKEMEEASKQKLEASYKKDIARVKNKIKERKEKADVPQEVDNKIQELRGALLKPTNFVDFIISTASQESINDLIDVKIDSAKVLDQITPKGALLFLSKMAERVGNDEIGEAFNKINDKPNTDEAKQVIENLNGKMEQLLKNYKKEIIKAFEIRLKFFIDNYGQKFQNKTNKVQVSPALKAFTTANMIREAQ